MAASTAASLLGSFVHEKRQKPVRLPVYGRNLLEEGELLLVAPDRLTLHGEAFSTIDIPRACVATAFR